MDFRSRMSYPSEKQRVRQSCLNIMPDIMAGERRRTMNKNTCTEEVSRVTIMTKNSELTPLEEEIKAFTEEKVKEADMPGFIVEVNFSSVEGRAPECNAHVSYQLSSVCEGGWGNMIDNYMCIYSDDKACLKNENVDEGITNYNYCENLDDLKTAIEKNIKEIEEKTKTGW